MQQEKWPQRRVHGLDLGEHFYVWQLLLPLLGFSLLRTGFGLNVPILFLVFVTSPPWGPGPQGEGYIDSG